jgi:hypothetical protein
MALLSNPFITTPQQSQQPQSGNMTPTGDQNNFQQTPTGNQSPNSQNGLIPPNVNNSQQGGNNQLPTGNQQPAGNNQEGDPLSDFSKLWDNDPPDPNNQQPQQPTTYLPPIDQNRFNQMLGQLDFTRNVTPEQKAALAAGGESAVQTMMEVVNMATRNAFAMGFQGTQRLIETGLGTAKDRFTADIPNYVKEQMSLDGLTSSNPIMRDPAYSKLVTDVRGQIQQKHPKATPSQVETAVNKYFDDMVGKLSQAKTQNSQVSNEDQNAAKLKSGAADANWEDWFTEAIPARQ